MHATIIQTMKSCFRQWVFASLFRNFDWFALQTQSGCWHWKTFFGPCRWAFCKITQRWNVLIVQSGRRKKKYFKNSETNEVQVRIDGWMSVLDIEHRYGRKSANNIRWNTSVSLNGATNKQKVKKGETVSKEHWIYWWTSGLRCSVQF